MDDHVTHLRHGQNFMRRNLQVIDPPGHATDLFASGWCLPRRKSFRQDSVFPLTWPTMRRTIPSSRPPNGWKRCGSGNRGSPKKRAGLVALIEHMDAGICWVLETLDRLQLSGDTLVLFTSDNGGLLVSRSQQRSLAEREDADDAADCGFRDRPFAAGHVPPAAEQAGRRFPWTPLATCCEMAGVAVPPASTAVSS